VIVHLVTLQRRGHQRTGALRRGISDTPSLARTVPGSLRGGCAEREHPFSVCRLPTTHRHPETVGVSDCERWSVDCQLTGYSLSTDPRGRRQSIQKSRQVVVQLLAVGEMGRRTHWGRT